MSDKSSGINLDAMVARLLCIDSRLEKNVVNVKYPELSYYGTFMGTTDEIKMHFKTGLMFFQ